ncbi:MAG: hypothetical protein KatS3mg111_2624 [Pirellulaceae bacterium]|nr:MAG: hypothetical protein KatS3mg111_2624 [Pirellulaceae bacterium]
MPEHHCATRCYVLPSHWRDRARWDHRRQQAVGIAIILWWIVLRRIRGSRWGRWAILVGCLTVSPHVGWANNSPGKLVPLEYGEQAPIVDLGVGLWAWPLPMDWDEDGDWDLVVACPDVPFRGIYLFENRQGNTATPVFEPPVRLSDQAPKNLRVSFIGGVPHVLSANIEYPRFRAGDFSVEEMRKVYPTPQVHQRKGNQRFNVWSYVDWEGDGDADLLVGVDDWGDYGWDDGYDEQGNWKRGRLHGYVYLLLNTGTDRSPVYDAPRQIEAGGQPLDVYGNPMPCLEDFDGDGDLDLLCGEFLDGFTYFENVGTRQQPQFVAGRPLMRDGHRVHLHVQMITPTSVDWDGDGDADIICGDEDGRVAWLENLGYCVDRLPQFADPIYLQQRGRWLKFGALVTPVGVDWDGDGDEDLVCGNTAGNIAVFENLGVSHAGGMPQWRPPRMLEVDGEPLRIMAGPNGSIQGPAEAKWGYTTLSVADWDHDGLQDLVVNSILGRVQWYRNMGEPGRPKLAPAQPVLVQWEGKPPQPPWVWWTPEPQELVTQWRTTPVVYDWNGDGWNDLIMLDHEGYLAWFPREERDGQLRLLPGRRIFRGGVYDSRHRAGPADPRGLLRLNYGTKGASGRRKLCVVDWDRDGLVDLLVNSRNCALLRNLGPAEQPIMEDHGDIATTVLAGHTTSPTTVDWDGDQWRDLVLGAEDGRLYYLRNPHADSASHSE